MTLLVISLIAMTLGRPPALVKQVYLSAPMDPALNVSVVEGESWFHPRALRVNYDKAGKPWSTDYGLYGINDYYHPGKQFRTDVQAHINYGGSFLAGLELGENGNRWKALRHYNSDPAYPAYIMAIFDRIKGAMLLDVRYGGQQ